MATLVDRLKSLSPLRLLVASMLASVVLSWLLTSAMSVIFHGRITYDYLITATVVATIVSFIVVSVINLLIRELHATEAMLMEGKNRYETLFQQLPDAVVLIDPETTLPIEFNEKAAQLLNYTEQEFAGLKIQDYEAVETPEEIRAHIEHILQEGKAVFETRMRTKDGAVKDIIVSIRVIDIGGRKVFHNIFHDITERKRAEDERNKLLAEVIKAKNEWEITFDSATEFIMLVDKGLNIMRCNKAFADFVGIAVNEIAGHKWHEVFPADPEQVEYLKDRIISKEPTEWIELKTETGHWFYVNHRPVFDEKVEYLHSIIIATDITALKYAQERLTASEQELKKRVEDLEKFYEMAVGRELRMKELKKEIQRLKTELSMYKK